ncbi:MAG: hypothetical protein U0W24_02455 [Bacteroidales bacterium]
MKQLVAIFLLFSVFSGTVAQDLNTDTRDSVVFKNFEAKPVGVVIATDTRLSDKCLFRDWFPADVTLYNGEIIRNLNLKYNGFEDAFIWLEPSTFANVRLERELIKEVKLITSGKTFFLFRLMEIDILSTINSKYNFINVLNEGKISLYVFRRFILYNLDQYTPSYRYLLKKEDGTITTFIPARRNLLNELPEHKKQLQSIIRKNRLNIKKETDLVQAIKLLNSQI